jgi:hypothetical protein
MTDNKTALVALLDQPGMKRGTVASSLDYLRNVAERKGDDFKFDLLPSKGLPAAALSGVLKNAHGRVKIKSVGPVEIMDVTVWGLPPNTDFDFFVIQVPNKPFGLAWYQGDIETNKDGKLGPVTGRIHTYHLGLWFNSTTDGAKAGAPGTTPLQRGGRRGCPSPQYRRIPGSRWTVDQNYDKR